MVEQLVAAPTVARPHAVDLVALGGCRPPLRSGTRELPWPVAAVLDEPWS